MYVQIIPAYQSTSPLKQKVTDRKVPWLNQELSQKRAEIRKLFNRAKRSGNWDEYREALTEYNIELRIAKSKTRRSFYQAINDMPATARL